MLLERPLRPQRLLIRVALLIAVAVCASPWLTGEAGAQSPAASANAAAPSASGAAAPPSTGGTENGGTARSPLAAAFAETAAQIRHLLADDLAADVSPKSLFDIDITDAKAVDLERQRLLQLREAREITASGGNAKAARSASAIRGSAAKAADQGSAAAGDAGASAVGEPPLASADEVDARLDLDRARLAFYSLPTSERDRLLRSQQARHDEQAQKPEAQLDEADQRARAAEQERLAALESAHNARTEALRLVSEEHARLLQVAQHQAEFEKTLVQRRSDLAHREESVLGWHRRVREATDGAASGDLNGAAVDTLYQELRTELRAARDLLATSLSEQHAESAVPAAGDDRLRTLPEDVPAVAPRAKRKVLEKEQARLAQLEAKLRQDALGVLYEEVVSLNRDRLALYPFLSAARRSEIVSFGPQGFDQARSEGRQVVLVLRQHLQATGQFLKALANPGGARSDSALMATLIAFKWLLPWALFIIWRRRAQATLAAWRDAAREERRSHRVVELSPVERVLGFVMRVRGPVEWLLLLGSVVWLLPTGAKNTLEVSLFSSIFAWTLGGSAAVTAIDALAAGGEGGSRKSRLVTAHVRLRSLRLIGRIVVAVALILSLSDQLVGRGTIYSWVLSTCWFTAVPVVLVIARWWHDIIHERLSLRRRKNAVDNWVLAHDHGWQRMAAALVGGAMLLGQGAYRWVRQRLTTFELTRRVLAYLFRRDMSRRTATGPQYTRLPTAAFDALGPETPSREIVPSIADDEVKRVIQRINAKGGGIFAIVGERGAGKSTLLRRILSETDDTLLIDCPLGDATSFARAFAVAVGSAEGTPLDDAAKTLDLAGRDVGLLIDDARHLIMPRMGGLDAFDAVLAVARRRSSSSAWVFAFDEVVWRFFERARGAKPLFDEVIRLEPWREEAIGRLLVSRTTAVGLSPSFLHLLTDLPEGADEVDVNEAIEQTAGAYYRLIWDYAGGNPGIALHAWRLCLGIDTQGQAAVRVFDAPDARELEALPDSAVFVIRAVVQLGLAHPNDILRATMLEPSEIEDALRFGLNRGYFKLVADRYWVTWAWFRPLTRFLQRRYLLSST